MIIDPNPDNWTTEQIAHLVGRNAKNVATFIEHDAGKTLVRDSLAVLNRRYMQLLERATEYLEK